MDCTITKNPDLIVISLEGRLDTAASVSFATKVDDLVAESPSKIEFDCKQLDYIASSGLRIFLNAYKKLSSTKGTVVLTHVQPAIMEVLKMTGFTSFLTIEQ